MIKIVKPGGQSPKVLLECPECHCQFVKDKGLCKPNVKVTPLTKQYTHYSKCPNCHCIAFGNEMT